MNNELFVTLLDSCTSQELTPSATTWDELLTHFKSPLRTGQLPLADYQVANEKTRKTEKDGLCWIPCSVKDQLGKRVQTNMDMAYLMVLDIDSGLELETIETVLGDFEFAVHSTYSHTPEKPKWRVALPLAEPINATELPVLFDRINALFNGKLDASCGHDPSRQYYLPACPKGAKDIFVFTHHKGKWMDPKIFISMIGLPKPVTEAVVTKHVMGSRKTTDFGVGFPDGQRTRELARRIGYCLAQGDTLEVTVDRCRKWNELNTPPLDDSKLIRTVESIARSHDRKSSESAEEVSSIIEAMNSKYAWINRQCQVYRIKYRDLVGPEKLRLELANTNVRAYSRGKVKDMTHAEAWIQSPSRRCYSDLVFRPGSPEYFDESINLWQGWGVTPVAGDLEPWTQLLDHIFNDDKEMRHWFECWVAYPIQHPGAKLNTAVVFWSSKQGIGKTLIGETIGKIYGEHFKIISAVELHSEFNSWARDCQLVLGEENSSADHRADANKLKHLLTGSSLYFNEKYQAAISVDNCMNFIFTSNNADAFHLEDHDRRFFVWGITAPKMSDEFYTGFINWRESDGASALMHYFLNLDISSFNHKASAPITESKKEMIEISRSDVERWIHDTLNDEETIKDVFGKEVVTIEDVCRAYKADHSYSSCNTTAMSRALKRKSNYAHRRVATHRGRKCLITLTQHEVWESRDNNEWAAEFKKCAPIDM